MLTVTSPARLSVAQRGDDNSARVTVAGDLKTAAAAVVEARAVLEEGRFGSPVEWTRVCEISTSGPFSGEMTVPAGGWYRLDVRATAGDEEVGRFSVERFGVGEVLVTAGQSNSANHGETPQKPWDDRVAAYHLGSWQVANDPQPGATGDGGTPWPALGSMLAESLQLPVGIASVGVGGTPLREWLDDPAYYKRMARLIRSLGGVRCVLWHQGESDAVEKTGTQSYVDGMTRLIRSVASESGTEVPWVVAQASRINVDPQAEEEIAAAQRELWKLGTALHGPSTDDMNGPAFRYDGAHFTQMGLRVHAARWFAFLWTHFFAG